MHHALTWTVLKILLRQAGGKMLFAAGEQTAVQDYGIAVRSNGDLIMLELVTTADMHLLHAEDGVPLLHAEDEAAL